MGKFQFPLQFLLLFTYLPILTYANENSVENISTELQQHIHCLNMKIMLLYCLKTLILLPIMKIQLFRIYL